MTTLEFDGIEKSFDGRSVLSSIYMKCGVGNVIGLLGRNGSGKSTLMKAVFGTLTTSFKSVRIDGKPLLGNYIHKKIIGYLPQHSWLPPHIKVRKTLNHFNVNENKLTASFPPFSDWMDYSTKQLSGGYQRVLEVFLLLHSAHRFVLLDEPFSGLMPRHIEAMITEINAVKKEKGIILSDHLYRHILNIADEVYLLSNGKTFLIKEEEELTFRGYLI